MIILTSVVYIDCLNILLVGICGPISFWTQFSFCTLYFLLLFCVSLYFYLLFLHVSQKITSLHFSLICLLNCFHFLRDVSHFFLSLIESLMNLCPISMCIVLWLTCGFFVRYIAPKLSWWIMLFLFLVFLSE